MALRIPLSVTPHLYMGDSTGRPLDGGKVYFGEVDKDPEFYPVNVFYDEALTIAAPQPIRTKGGFMNANGQMVEVYAEGIEYSVKVLDSYGRQVFYKESMSSDLDIVSAELKKEISKQYGVINIGNAPISVDSIDGLMKLPALIRLANRSYEVVSYHLNKNCGGGVFKWDSAVSKSLHNGGTVINPDLALPLDWDNQGQLESWLYPVGLTGTGCWVREELGSNNIQVFGALPDGVNRVNLILERMSDLSIAIYAPKGVYRVEDFTRKLRVHSNLDQKSMRIFGDLTYGSTDQNYAWTEATVFQGSGDMFKAVVNMRLDNLLFRNTPTGTLGKLFTLGAFSQCEMSNCTFGPSNYHIYNAGKGMAGYNVKPSYRNCRFYGAKEWSRYFEGVVANYREENCYTSTNKRGLYLAAPITASIESCVYEYNELNAITLDAYGYTTKHSLSLKDVFFETNGAGVFGSGVKSLPHIVIKSEKEGGVEPKLDAARINFKQENCYYTDTSSGPKAESAIFIDSKTTNIVDLQCWIEPSIRSQTDMYSGSLTGKTGITWQYADNINSLISVGNYISQGDNSAVETQNNIASVTGSHCILSIDRKRVLPASQAHNLILAKGGSAINGVIYVSLGIVYAEYRITGNSEGFAITEISKTNFSEVNGNFEISQSGYPKIGLSITNTGSQSRFLSWSFSGNIYN